MSLFADSIIALGLVILQGLFGGLTVLFYLPTAISMIHGILAQTFFLILILISFFLSKEFINKKKFNNTNKKIFRWSIITFVVIYIQLILGAWMRHINAGLAIPDFPTIGSYWYPWISDNVLQNINSWRFDYDFPIINSFPAWVHLAHRIWAIMVLCSVFIFGNLYFKGNRSYNFTMFLLYFSVTTQIILGAFTIWSGKLPLITSLHVLNGAILLGLSFLMFIRYFTSYKYEN